MVVRIKHKPNLDMEISIIRGNLQKLIAVNANRALLTVDLALGLIGTYMLRTVTSGLRLGTPALTTRGMKEEQMAIIADLISICAESEDVFNSKKKEILDKVSKLTKEFPLYE